jgi:NTP pyrophosphatase (non-canonical NTP hydrolase)
MNRTEHLLTCLMEECAEVQKAAAKALRFGLENGSPDTQTTNAQDIAKECTDLIAIMEMLEMEHIIKAFRLFPSINEKKVKVNTYMEKAKEWGTLV